MSKSAFKMVCRVCGRRLWFQTRNMFEQCGSLFRHVAIKDESEMYDMEVGHVAEPNIVDLNGDVDDGWRYGDGQ